jgi:hypothetical protein
MIFTGTGLFCYSSILSLDDKILEMLIGQSRQAKPRVLAGKRSPDANAFLAYTPNSTSNGFLRDFNIERVLPTSNYQLEHES